MALIEPFLTKLFRVEGGFQKSANDRGNFNSRGELVGTNMGITARDYEKRIGRPPSEADMRSMSKEDATGIYEEKYWNKHRIREINSQPLAEILCDAIVNHGPGSNSRKGGVTMMQQTLNDLGESLEVDGKFGPRSIEAINRVGADREAMLHNHYRDRRIQFYRNIVKFHPGQSVFLNGWLNRMDMYPSL